MPWGGRQSWKSRAHAREQRVLLQVYELLSPHATIETNQKRKGELEKNLETETQFSIKEKNKAKVYERRHFYTGK